MRTTIDYGIDLGTTNSEIALFKGTEVEVIKNNENFENTPSAVWIDVRGHIRVGRQAREMHETDSDNAKIEFKRQMGKAEPVVFRTSGRKMLPEDLSAEVLKQLKENVKERQGEEITAAVITVPADFNAAQIAATNRAARLAGLTVSPLLQEPVAAAMAYGFQEQSDSDRVRWLVYDFGGGTFDAALIHKRDGMIRVENHGGDKYLGGKDIDSALVDDLLVPALLQRFPLRNFSRDNQEWRGAFARLKIQAELAKISLSRAQTAVIDIRDLCKDGNGQTVDFEYEIQRADLERLAEPLIAKSINICRDVLAESRLEPGDIEKLILVGGPTLMPYLRQRLCDKIHGLGIPLEFRVDPFTVVARGAALFAGAQPLPPTDPVKEGEFQIKLDYKAIGPDVEPVVSGQVTSSDGADLSRFTIEFVNKEAHPLWRSGKLGLSPDGHFMTTLWAAKGRQNEFAIELMNPSGVRQITTPDSFSYTVGGGGVSTQALIHSIGVVLADNTVDVFFAKGVPLPARAPCHILLTTVDARRGSGGDVIKVPIVEGEEKRADRNELVGTLEILATGLKRDVPAGSEIEVIIEVDESRRYLTRAYLPLLNEDFEAQFITGTKVPSFEQLTALVAAEKKRLADLRGKAGATGDARAQQLLQRVDSERLEHDVDAALAAARNEEDARDKCASRLRDLQIALDAVEEALQWPELVARAEKEIGVSTDIVQRHGKGDDRQLLATRVREVKEAIAHRDQGLLRTRLDELSNFSARIWQETPEFWVGALGWLEGEKSKMRDRAEAERLFSQGVRAMNSNDLDGLKAAVRQLHGLLPRGPSEPGSFGSTLALRM